MPVICWNDRNANNRNVGRVPAFCTSVVTIGNGRHHTGAARTGESRFPPLPFQGGTMKPDNDAENARQGEIILKRPWQRVIFLAGLFGCVALLFLALLLRF